MIGEQHGAQLGEFLAADPRARELASLRRREPLNHNRRCLSSLGRGGDAGTLALTALYASAGDPKFHKAAVRWLARFALEADRVTLADLELTAVSLAALPARGEPVLQVLLGLLRDR
jgi:hypothetical protein